MEELNEKVDEEAKSRKKMVDEMKKMREDIKLLKELCMEGDEVRNDVYNRILIQIFQYIYEVHYLISFRMMGFTIGIAVLML